MAPIAGGMASYVSPPRMRVSREPRATGTHISLHPITYPPCSGGATTAEVLGRSAATAVYWSEGASTESYSYLIHSTPTQ